MASTGSTIVNWFTSESDDFDLTIALLSSNSFQCHWFANRQCSYIHFPLHPRSGNYAWSFLPLILSSFLPTTLWVLASIVLQHYRLWYSGLIPFMVTRSPLYVQTVGGLFIGQLVSLTILPSTGVAMSLISLTPLPIRNDCIERFTWTLPIERFTWTLPPDNLPHWFTSKFDDSNMKIDQLSCLYAPSSSSVILLASYGKTPRTTILAQQKNTQYTVTIRTPIEFPNGDQTVRVRGTHVYTTRAMMRQVIFWLHHQTLQRKKTSIRIH